MIAIVLFIPLFLIRYGLLGMLSKEALRRAAHFPPMEGNEKLAYWLYEILMPCIFIALCFLKIRTDTMWFIPGLLLYTLGTLLFIISVFNYARPSASGINTKGLYRVSRNPMYVSYLLYFLGCALITDSLILLALTLILQVSSHWIIRAEERWCIREFGQEYVRYMERVGRYV